MDSAGLQNLCERGQQLLMRTDYIGAIEVLAGAEEGAWEARDFDTLARLYMPLQEARRQFRQRCGEGRIRLDLVAEAGWNVDQQLSGVEQGQILAAGWGSVRPGLEVRRMARERKLYLEGFLAAAYRVTDGGEVVAVVPMEDAVLPAGGIWEREELVGRLPMHTVLLERSELPGGWQMGSTATFGWVMNLWERLHGPFLAEAERTVDVMERLAGYRKVLRVDAACELAHQHLAGLAGEMERNWRAGVGG